MRIVLIGQAPFGAKVLETLLEKGEDIVAVYVPPDRPGGRLDPLKEAALDKDIQVIQPPTYKDDQVFKAYKELQPDLTVMAFVTDIIPAHYFDIPSQGTINYHPSILPRHRGGSAINWAVIMGDEKTGLTIFWPDGGIDTGPILLQKEVEIGPDDTTGSIYFDHLYTMGVDAIIESIQMIRDGNAPKIVQDENKATSEPLCNDLVAAIDWTKPAKEVHNLIRGCDPQPGAFVMQSDEKLRLYGPRLFEESTDKPAGSLIHVDEAGMHLAVDGGKIIVSKVKSGKNKKMNAAEYIAEQGLQPGDLLGG